MTETVSEFRARVARLLERHPEWREGQAYMSAMALCRLGATVRQRRFADRVFEYVLRGIGGNIDPFHNDANIPAFLAAAVEAGVLREG